MSPRMRRFYPFLVLIGLLTLTSRPATAQGLIDYSHIDLTTSGATVTDLQGVKWAEGASGGGTGVFHPFLRVQADGVEKGFNTDYRPVPLDDKVGSWTHSVTLASLGTVTIGEGDSAVQYHSFHLDANEMSGDPDQLLLLEDLRLYSSPDSAIADTSALFSDATLLYEMPWAQDVRISTSLHPGSGTADMTVLIPVSFFDAAGPGSRIYLYASFGDTEEAGLGASAGFEEWAALGSGDAPPAVTAPLAIDGEEGGALTFGVSASDPDGDPIGSLTSNLTSLPVGNDASFTVNDDNSEGTFLWHMMPGEAGSYDVTFTASSNDLDGSATTHIGVTPAGSDINGIFSWTPQEGQEGTYYVTFTATDAGGTTTQTDTINVVPIFLAPSPGTPQAPGAPTRLGGPRPVSQSPSMIFKGPIISGTSTVSGSPGTTLNATVSASTDVSGTAARVGAQLSVRIMRSAASTQSISLTADLSGLPAGNDATFTVDNQPAVTATPSITVLPGAPMSVPVTATDPDGDAIESLTADLSGLPSANPGAFVAGALNQTGTFSWTPRLADVGSYLVTFIATNRMVGQASTTITVGQPAAARIFVMDPVKFNIGSQRSANFVFIEPIDGSFALTDVDLTTIRLISPGTGAVSEIGVVPNKPALIEDKDNNHIQDLQVSFAKADLRSLFSLLTKKTLVTVQLQGQLTSGAYFGGTFQVEVIANGPSVGTASVSPNPLNPRAKLSLNLGKGGWLKVTLFDTQGRMVRELANETNAVPGPRDIIIDGMDSRGRPLASGVYYYRVDSADGQYNGRLAIVR